MKIYNSEKMQQDALYPTTLDIQRILKIRDPNFTYKHQYDLDRREAGARGEQIVYEFLLEYGQEHWVVIRNYWMNYSGEQEYDLILITGHACYIFEVKNYKHLFILEDGVCKLNGQFMDKHIITQTIRCSKNLMQIFRRTSLDVKVRGTLVFIGEHSRIQIKDKVYDIDINQKNELRDYIQRIAREEKSSVKASTEAEQVIQSLSPYEMNTPHPAEAISVVQSHSLIRGISCAICHNFNIHLKKNWVECSCGTKESKEEAVIRIVCEYGLLHFTNSLKAHDLRHFMANQISENYLRKVLSRHFKKIENYSYTYYTNMRLPYYKIKSKFIGVPSIQITLTPSNINLLQNSYHLQSMKRQLVPF